MALLLNHSSLSLVCWISLITTQHNEVSGSHSEKFHVLNLRSHNLERQLFTTKQLHPALSRFLMTGGLTVPNEKLISSTLRRSCTCSRLHWDADSGFRKLFLQFVCLTIVQTALHFSEKLFLIYHKKKVCGYCSGDNSPHNELWHLHWKVIDGRVREWSRFTDRSLTTVKL